jgi:hypothetical protein
MRETLKIRKKWVEYWFERAAERERMKNPMLDGHGFDDGRDSRDSENHLDITHPDGKNDYDELYETLLITGELDLPGEWD